MLNLVNNGSYLIFLVIKLDLAKPGTDPVAAGSKVLPGLYNPVQAL